MSKIGKINIPIPEKVKVLLSGNTVNVEGPLGKHTIKLDLEMFELNITEGKDVSIKPKKLDDTSKRLWGMNRSLLNNAIIGASSGYEKILELTGVGFRAALKGNVLNMQLGFSHDINFDIPSDIKIECPKQNLIKLSSINKEKLGAAAAKIRSFRKPEPFKGKGIKYIDEYIFRKEGKKK